jgi:hypothetical protein
LELLDITNWQTIEGWVPIGKRIKNVVFNPINFQYYYFKEPKEKYPWEFWTEIVASVVGKELGFNTLEYLPAQMNDIGGCLSKSMTQIPTEELIHGQQYLIRIMPDFEIKKGTDHTFQLIEKFFTSDIRVKHLLDDFIRMLIFDAIIGNRDRHQQNWAIIREIRLISNKSSFSFLKSKRGFLRNFSTVATFSPFFDNGNCLAYNQIEKEVIELLRDSEKIEKYLFGPKAVSHVRWEGNSLTHLDLLSQIKQIYPIVVLSTVQTVKEKFDRDKITSVINSIDNDVIFANPIYSLTQKRKELMTKLIVLRTERLLNSF